MEDLRFKSSLKENEGVVVDVSGSVWFAWSEHISSSGQNWIGSRVHCLIDMRTISQEEGTNESMVDDHWSVSFNWKEAPDEEDNLGQPVKGEPTEDDVREEFDSCK